MGALQPVHWLILIVVVVLLFGAKKLPDAARGLGRSMRIFKSEMKEMGTDGHEQPAQGELPTAQPNAAAYPTAQASAAQQAFAPDGRPAPPQPVWDPETQQYVLPQQQPPAQPGGPQYPRTQ